ncbi:MAG: hypothetical protein AAGB22_00475 [Bacteroidota bacterium]
MKPNRSLGSGVVLLSAFLILSVAGCDDKYFDFDRDKALLYEPTIAAPLVNTVMDMSDILGDSSINDLFVQDATGFLALVYTATTETVTAREFYELPGFSESQTFSLDAALITAFNAAGSISVPFSTTFNYDPGPGISLETVEVRSGEMVVNINSDFRHSGSLAIGLPTATRGGNALQENIPFTFSGSVPVVTSRTIDISGYTFDLTDGGTTVNSIPADLVMALTNSGNNTDPSDELVIDISFENMEYELLIGDFGQQQFDLDPDSVNLDAFNNAFGGSFRATDPSVEFRIANSFGIPIELQFSEFRSRNVNTGRTVDLGGPGVTDPKLIERAQSPGDVALSSFVLNTDNTTNVVELIEPSPKFVTYEYSVTGNPSGPANPLNFISSESEFVVDAEVTIPLEGYATNLTFGDTLNFEFGSDDNVDNVKSALIRTNIINGFPMDLESQVIFLDEFGQAIDSLYNGPTSIVAAGIVPPNDGRVTIPGVQVTDVVIENERIVNILQADKAFVRIKTETFMSDEPRIVRIFNDYEIDIKIGIIASTSVEVND